MLGRSDRLHCCLVIMHLSGSRVCPSMRSTPAQDLDRTTPALAQLENCPSPGSQAAAVLDGWVAAVLKGWAPAEQGTEAVAHKGWHLPPMLPVEVLGG